MPLANLYDLCRRPALGLLTHVGRISAPCFYPIVKKDKQSFSEQRKIMSKQTRKKNEMEDCYVEKTVVMSGGTSGGSKIFIIFSFVFLKTIVSVFLTQTTRNKGMTGQKIQGWVEHN